MSEHARWCGLNPANGYTVADDVACECAEPSLAAVMAEVLAVGVRVDDLTAKFDQAAGQINNIAEMAGPAIAQISESPMLRMLTGGGRRERSRTSV